MNTDHIRNFSIIAHIDHGKSTLADRFLDSTHTVEARRMKDQMLDTMELERERGITIKMQPVRMEYEFEGEKYVLNLIDTPGHIDFSYEVSRALAACEGAILLVDATQGIQAQTLSHFHAAKNLNLKIIPVLNKIDSGSARPDEVKKELNILGFKDSEVLLVSAKEGTGVRNVLNRIIKDVPSPKSSIDNLRALVYDSSYDEHGGIIAYIRIFDGEIKKGDKCLFMASGEPFEAKEVGVFMPSRKSSGELKAGEIGYVITGIKSPDIVRIGDTIIKKSSVTSVKQLSGYKDVSPVVWAGFFPEDQDQFEGLGDALKKLRLNDASLSFHELSTAFLGRGYECGFLGTLHLEIIAERVRREFGISFIVTSPSVSYIVKKGSLIETVSSPHLFPGKGSGATVEEPIINVKIIVPEQHISAVLKLQERFEMKFGETDIFGSTRVILSAEMPLRTFVKDFVDMLHRSTSGYASINYEHAGYKAANLKRIDIVIAGEEIEALSRVVNPSLVERESRTLVSAIKETLPREQFEVRIQALSDGRIVASERLSALKKDVTGHLYGGDISRKMKLWKKQKKGKKRLKNIGNVRIGTETFIKLLKK